MALAKKVPQRSCVGCRTRRDKKDFLRVVRTPAGSVVLDLTGKQAGRGVYLCRQETCLKRALKARSLEKALQVPIPPEVYDEIKKQLESQ